MTLANVPQGEIDGMPSSIAQAGVEGGVTLNQGTAARSGQKSVQELARQANGWQGALRHRRRDRPRRHGGCSPGGRWRIRREVAVKYMLDQKDPRKKARFIEEAQINAQLEHPNIVPVYDLRMDPRGGRTS